MESYTTVSEAIEGLKARGFTTDFEFINGQFRGFKDGRFFNADELTIVEHYRFEGISNPDDESIVFAIESNDGVRGVLVDAYGLYANPELAAFLKNVAIQRGV
jgi:hypothetical protein